MAVTKRDVKRPETKLIPAYPRCGTCPYALISPEQKPNGEPIDVYFCHGWGPQYVWFPNVGLQMKYVEVGPDMIGCEKHPLWPEELRKPFLNGRPRKAPG
jgi:hypothetical protein